MAWVKNSKFKSDIPKCDRCGKFISSKETELFGYPTRSVNVDVIVTVQGMYTCPKCKSEDEAYEQH